MFISFVNVGWCDLRAIASLVGAYQALVVSASFSGKKQSLGTHNSCTRVEAGFLSLAPLLMPSTCKGERRYAI